MNQSKKHTAMPSAEKNMLIYWRGDSIHRKIMAHDALVEACKEALAYAKMHDCMSMEPLQKAIKLAKGE